MYIRSSWCVGLCITIMLIHRRIIVASHVHQGVGHSPILGSTFGGTEKNTEETSCACLSHSVTTFFTYQVLQNVHKGDKLAGEELTYEIKMEVVFLLEKVEVMFMLAGE